MLKKNYAKQVVWMLVITLFAGMMMPAISVYAESTVAMYVVTQKNPTVQVENWHLSVQ